MKTEVIIFERALKQKTDFILREGYGFKPLTREQAEFMIHACQIPARIIISEVIDMAK